MYPQEQPELKQNTIEKKQKFAELDIARFFAAFAVVMFHYIGRPSFSGSEWAYEIAKFGFLGVPFFFVISGFVISISAEHSTPIKFFIARFVRLFPTLWVCSTITFVMLLVTQYPFKEVSNLMFFANFAMLNQILNIGYVDNVYWTLFEEIKFYFLVGMLLLFKVYNKFKWWLCIWLALSVLYVFTDQPFFLGKLTSIKYSGYFIAGVCFYLIHKNRHVGFAMGILLVSFILTSYHITNHTPNYITDANTLDKTIVFLLNICVYGYFFYLIRENTATSTKHIFVVLGGMTYPLYLIHNLFGKSLIFVLTDTVGETLAILLALSAALFLSYLISNEFERKCLPIIKQKLFRL